MSVDDYAGVLVPLEEAHLYSYTARTGRSEYETLAQEDDNENDDEADDEDDDTANNRRKDAPADHDVEASETAGMLPMQACEYTIAGLRAEVRRGPKSSQSPWTNYEREHLFSTDRILHD